MVVLGDGDVVADGPALGARRLARVRATGRKILHPVTLLTVDDVVEASGAAS